MRSKQTIKSVSVRRAAASRYSLSSKLWIFIKPTELIKSEVRGFPILKVQNNTNTSGILNVLIYIVLCFRRSKFVIKSER